MREATMNDAIVEEVTIRAAASRVFDALTNPEERMKWWGAPGRFQVAQFESDLRAGGKWAMRGSGLEGKPFTITGKYLEIDRPRLLVFTWLPDWYEGATETIVRWELEEQNGLTTVRLTHSGFTSEIARASHRGWPQILGWLQSYAERP